MPDVGAYANGAGGRQVAGSLVVMMMMQGKGLIGCRQSRRSHAPARISINEVNCTPQPPIARWKTRGSRNTRQ